MGNVNQLNAKPKQLSLPGSDPGANDMNLTSILKMQNTEIVEWYGQAPELWDSWPEPVFYKLFLDPEGRNASLAATKVNSNWTSLIEIETLHIIHFHIEVTFRNS